MYCALQKRKYLNCMPRPHKTPDIRTGPYSILYKSTNNYDAYRIHTEPLIYALGHILRFI